MKKILLALGFIAMCSLSVVASAADSLKIGFVYVSPIGDAGWTYQHDLGRQAIEKKFGDKIETKYVESVNEGPDAERVIRRLASTGYDLIFATSFGYMNPTVEVAKVFPKVVFEHATGYKLAKNLGNYSPRFYEGRYLSGIVAGEATKSGVIGYVAAFPVPEVVRGINSFVLGAQTVNPDVTVKVIWTNSWFDPGKEAEASGTLVAQGADVLTHHTDSVAIVTTARDEDIKAIAYHSNMEKHGGDAQIGAVVHNWENFYTDTVNQVFDGSWKSTSVWYGLKEGMVDFLITSDLDTSTTNTVNKTKAGIISGSIHPFQGPIVDQSGKQKAAYGTTLSDKQLLTMDYFVKGVEGKLE